LAQKIDLACFAVVFRHRIDTAAMKVEIVDEDEGRIVKKMVSLNYRLTVVPYFWIPEDTMLEHEKVDGVPYSHWKEAGLITVTDGPTIDYNRIYDDITTKILPAFPRLKQGFVGYDPAFATDIASELRDRAGMKVEEILQNYKYMSEACYISEALIKAKHVSHGGHRVLRNHWENVSVKADDARRIRPVKPKKASKHIDGVVSTLMGIKSLAKVPDQKKGVRMFFMGGQQHAPTP
jgi:phage terminase large subunit-like protein